MEHIWLDALQWTLWLFCSRHSASALPQLMAAKDGTRRHVNLMYAGMGQIASRAFGGFEDPGLAPFIDLMNHADQASHPLG